MFNLTILEKDLNLEQDCKNYTYFEYYLSRDFYPLFFYFYNLWFKIFVKKQEELEKNIQNENPRILLVKFFTFL